MSARLRSFWSCALLLFGGCSSQPVPEEQLPTSTDQGLIQRDVMRAFYSGHSLTDGVPEAVDMIAKSLGKSFSFQQQSILGSLLRVRTKGNDVSAPGFPGYRTGRNNTGEGLDVQAELSAQREPAQRYQALVVTERHDLPWSALNESTPRYLTHIVSQLLRGNADADAYFYHTWLDIDVNAPELWIRYERKAQRHWECVASAANRQLKQQQLPARIRLLPGAAALTLLVEELVAGSVPGLSQTSAIARLQLIFRDKVHLTPLGTYYMGLVHYAQLFGQSPRGAAAPSGVSSQTVQHLQELAYRAIRDYAPQAEARAQRQMSACREFAANEMCSAFYEFRNESGITAPFKRRLGIYRCQEGYRSERTPFPD